MEGGRLSPQSVTRSLDGKTPYEAWYNKKPAVHHLHVFGCVAYMKVTHPHLAKLDPRGLKVIFIDYEPGSKVYRLYDPVGGKLMYLTTSSSTKAPSGSGTT